MKAIRFLQSALVVGVLVSSSGAFAQCAGGGFMDAQGICQNGAYGSRPYGSNVNDGVSTGSNGISGHQPPERPPFIPTAPPVTPVFSSDMAYALSKETRSFGGGVGTTQAEAKAAAVKKCGKGDCQVMATITKGYCMAAVWGRKNNGDNYDFVGTGKKESEVKKAALKNCQTNAGNQCQIYFSECSR